MRMYRGSVALGSFRLQKPYITLLLSKVSVISAKPPPARQSNTISQWGRLAAVGPRWDGKTWSQTSVINPFFTRVQGLEVRISQNAWWATANPCLALIRFFFFFLNQMHRPVQLEAPNVASVQVRQIKFSWWEISWKRKSIREQGCRTKEKRSQLIALQCLK